MNNQTATPFKLNFGGIRIQIEVDGDDFYKLQIFGGGLESNFSYSIQISKKESERIISEYNLQRCWYKLGGDKKYFYYK